MREFEITIRERDGSNKQETWTIYAKNEEIATRKAIQYVYGKTAGFWQSAELKPGYGQICYRAKRGENAQSLGPLVRIIVA